MKNVWNSSRGRSQGVPKVLRTPCMTHCAVIFAIAQLSCNLYFLNAYTTDLIKLEHSSSEHSLLFCLPSFYRTMHYIVEGSENSSLKACFRLHVFSLHHDDWLITIASANFLTYSAKVDLPHTNNGEPGY